MGLAETLACNMSWAKLMTIPSRGGKERKSSDSLEMERKDMLRKKMRKREKEKKKKVKKEKEPKSKEHLQ